MRRLSLHIGTHKTGSTAIQAAFDGYSWGDARYASLEFRNHSIPFYTVFSGKHQDYHIWRSANLTPAEIEKKKQQLHRLIESEIGSDTRHLIVSGEDISLIDHKGIEAIADLCSKANRKVDVIVYVRDPVSFTQSDFQETIKSGSVLARPPYMNYRNRIEKFLTIFGADHVTFRHYDRSKLVDGDVVSDFSEVIGVRKPRKTATENTSLSTEAVRILWALNSLVPRFTPDKAIKIARTSLIDHLRTVFPGKFQFPESISRSLIDIEDVEWLKHNSGIDFTPVGPRPGPFDNKEYLAFLNAFTDEMTTKLRDHVQGIASDWNDTDDRVGLVARYFMTFLRDRDQRAADFSPGRYLDLNPDVRRAGVDPFVHFVKHGFEKGRRVV
ncbi:hypothetical protein LV82_01515 [Albidovulum inexpectatum]|uniref:Sulfotransferase family protein n=1 Tax=Albidovulum inexpectatum TaxID=196587 RepID=A0A2S5JH31_9RHOB|nr:hypothetical protein [Albidovulum inexpectatum]PPB80783.1 hypothetical protein LV82_01515 [Albidovulum inexpectatum]